MPRIYIHTNTHLLQKFDKGYSVPVGLAAIKNMGAKKNEIPSLLDKKDELGNLDQIIELATKTKDIKLSSI